MKEGKNLVIVESPAKAGTIQKFLGEGFTVKSSFGHIRDLSESELSIDVEGGFNKANNGVILVFDHFINIVAFVFDKPNGLTQSQIHIQILALG